MAAIRNTNYYEMGLRPPEGAGQPRHRLYIDYRRHPDAIDAEGCVPVPQGPGSGVQIDWDWVERHRTGLVVYEP